MAGRKHHFIQQLLLRGFAAAKSKKGKAQLWLYQRDAEPVLAGTNNVFTQRDFYGPAPSALDGKITDSEAKFQAVIGDLRARKGSGVHPIGQDSDIAEFICLTSVRGRWIRTLFEEFGRGATERIAGQLTDQSSLVELLRSQIAKEPDFLGRCFEREFKASAGRPLNLEEQIGVGRLAEEVGANLEDFKELFDPAPIQAMFRQVQEDMAEVSAGGHIKGLLRSFDRTEYQRYLESFRWSVDINEDVSYILGDCGPLYLSSASHVLGPMGIWRRPELHGVVMPISRSHTIVGELDPPAIAITADALNLASAEWSKHGFVASERSETCVNLQAVLGARIDRYLETILGEIVV